MFFMTLRLPKIVLLSTAFFSLAACATMEPSPQIADTQGRLAADYNDKAIAERGQGDLANAKTALELAQAEWTKGDHEKSDHQLTMARTYLDLAETRGQQAKVEQATARLTGQAQLADKNAQIAGQNQLLADKNAQIDGQNQQLANQDQALANKDRALADAQAQLRDYDMKTSELGSTMVLQDVAFETGKFQLLAGGVNRLQPLINYLRLSPNTRVRIDGFTDNVGGAAYNQELSLNRANSVRDTLIAAGIDAGRIETSGSGLSKPVASNKTEAGRQSNRRVEITLLKQPGV
jgi:outer membrane protein OmpA-like peptidoglycan-associated protein